MLVDAANEVPSYDVTEEYRAMLAAAPSPNRTQDGHEAAAWRCKDFADGWIVFQFKEHAEAYRNKTGCLMEPLYPPLSSVPASGYEARTIEACANVARVYAINAERRAADHVEPAARIAATDKAEAGYDIEHRIRALSSVPVGEKS